MRPASVLLLLALSACGGADTVAAPTPAGGPGTSLVVEQDGRRTTLTCEPAGGDHPRPDQACAVLDALVPVPQDAVCTQQYGGPQTATVRGTSRGEPVDLALSRTDGCRIAQWDRLEPLLAPPS